MKDEEKATATKRDILATCKSNILKRQRTCKSRLSQRGNTRAQRSPIYAPISASTSATDIRSNFIYCSFQWECPENCAEIRAISARVTPAFSKRERNVAGLIQ